MVAGSTAPQASKLVAVALANKIARTAWAMMTCGETYRRQSAALEAVAA